jgi:hypothetical protein
MIWWIRRDVIEIAEKPMSNISKTHEDFYNRR